MTSSTAEDTLGALSELIERITTRQGDIALHRENIRLATEAGLDDESAAARELATMFVAAGESVWLPLLAHKTKELEDTLNAFKELLSLYQQASQDYLCASLCAVRSRGSRLTMYYCSCTGAFEPDGVRDRTSGFDGFARRGHRGG